MNYLFYGSETFSLSPIKAIDEIAKYQVIKQDKGTYGLKISSNQEGHGYVETEVNGLVVGDTYTLNIEFIEIVSNDFGVFVNPYPGNNLSPLVEGGPGLGKRSLTFVATVETVWVAFGEQTGYPNITYSIADNISLKKDGVELIQNGTFETDTSGWNPQEPDEIIIEHYEYNPTPIDPPVDLPDDPVPTGTIYYFAADGDDTNDGLSKNTPFKSLDKFRGLIQTASAGTGFLFAMGDEFRYTDGINDDRVPGGSGDEDNTTLPILTGSKTITPTWTSQGNDIWTTPNFTNHRSRLLKDGVEQIQVQLEEDWLDWDDTTEIWFGDDGNIHHRTTTDPNGSVWTYTDAKHLIGLEYCGHYIINAIDVQWTQYWGTDIYFSVADNITVQKCNISKFSHSGVSVLGNWETRGENIKYIYNYIDTGWRRYAGNHYYRSSDDLLVHNQMVINQYGDYHIVEYNQFIDFWHVGMNLSNIDETKNLQGGKWRYNLFYAPNSSYGRPMDSTSCVHDGLEIAYNVFDQCSTQCQVEGDNVHLHHNIFSNWFLNHKSTTTNIIPSVCEQLSSPMGRMASGFIAENNVFYNLEMPAFKGYGKFGETIRNNIFFDCSTNITTNPDGTDGDWRGCCISPMTWDDDTYDPINRVTNIINNNLFYDSVVADPVVMAVGSQQPGYERVTATFTVSELNSQAYFTADNNLLDDPEFIDTDEYRIPTGSPADDTGIQPLATEDYDGNPITAPYNIGLYNTEDVQTP